RSLLYPEGSDFSIVMIVVRFPMTIAVLDRVISSGSGFLFFGMALDVDACLSLISIKPNSCEDQIIRSSDILLNVIITEAIFDVNSIIKSLEDVASMEFDIKLSNPSSFAVIFLSIGNSDPPIGPAPNGD